MSDAPYPTHPPDAGPATTSREGSTGSGDRRTSPRLGDVLREARERSGLGLSDLSGVTHVRRAYLEALEGGRYADLPEDVYTRNFLRLYAHAVGVDAETVIEHYLRERRTAIGLTTLEQQIERDRRPRHAAPASLAAAPRRRGAALPAWLLGPWLPTALLVAIVVAIGLWGFNQLFARRAPVDTPRTAAAAPAPTAPEASPSTTAAGDAAATVDAGPVAGGLAVGGLAAPALAGPGQAATSGQVRVDLLTTPPGASVTIDGFRIPGRTPLTDIPVTGRDGRVIRAELEGYEPLEVVADLSVDARVEMVLTPVTAEAAVTATPATSAAPATPGAPGAPGAPVATTARSSVVVAVSETSWLEVWRSTARNTGERLVFTTAQPGARYEVQPPVYVHVGNAGGVRITVDGRDLGPMGSPGAVLGRAYAP